MTALSQNEKALLDAARDGDLDTVKRLVRRKVDVNVQDECGYTPLHHAVRWQHTAVVQFLLENGANPNAKAKMLKMIRGDTPLYLATMARIHEYVEIIPLLARAGAELNSPDADDNLPLHLVVKAGIPELIECLIDHGANVNARNSLGNTPLHIACHSATWCKPEVIELLFRKGAAADSETFDQLIALASDKAERNHRDAIVELLQSYRSRAQRRPEERVDKIRFRCPHCSTQLNAPPSSAGRRAKCPKCSKIMSVPGSPSRSSATSPLQSVQVDGDETRTWQVLAGVPRDQLVTKFPDFDVAYLKAAYPSGNSGDHASASHGLVEQGLEHCVRKSLLLGRLSAYFAWKGDARRAFDYAVRSLLSAKAVPDSPGDLVGCLNLLAEVFGATGHPDVEGRLRGLNPGYDESDEMKDRIAAVANQISALRDKAFVSLAADALRSKEL